MRKLAIEYRPLASLIPYARNSRTHSPEQVEQICSSMTEFGWTNPVLVDGESGIIAGHGRVLAAKRLGIDPVPCIELSGLSEAQRRAYILADNKLALNAGWDEALLRVELADLRGMAFDLSVIGFGEAEQAALLNTTEGLTDPDDAPEVPEHPVSEPGDLWILERHRLLCGDSTVATDVERVLGGVEPHLMVTSPPYNQKIDGFKPSGMHKEGGWVRKVGKLAYADDLPERDYQDQQRDLLALWFSVVRTGASIFYNHKNRYRDKRVVSPLEWLPGPFTLRQEIIWRRPGSVTQNARMFLPCDERIFWLYKGDDFTFNDTTEIKTWSSVWDMAPKPNLDHAVAFPVELPERCIRACSEASGAVYEPFSGSGTTIIAAEMTGRSCHAIELSPAYVDVAVKRWQSFTGKQAALDGDGRAFDEVASERAQA